MRDNPADRLTPQVKQRLWARAELYDRRFLADIFSRIPRHIAPRLLVEWEKRLETLGRRESNLYALSLKTDLLPELFPDAALPFDATDDEIADAAERAVRRVRERIRLHEAAGQETVIAAMTRVAHRYRVEPPRCNTVAGVIARMTDAAWWRRALRKRFQVVEHAAIRAGCVHRRAAPYVSDEAYRRHERHARKMSALLEALEAVNEETGECCTLAELRNTSTANPTIRRYAMMACVRGLEARAKALGFVGVFLTITCPSRLHARLEKSGDPNLRYDGTSPRAAQAYLARKVWNAGMRKLKHASIAPGREFFGLRTVEPHHDATPHWHVLAFVAPDRLDEFTATLRAYALADSPDEPGAAERRFTVEHIDPAKGSAARYIAKYVSKNTDGAGVGADNEADGDAAGSAARVVVWARLWNARQFQFFGIGAISPFRELYRLDRVPEPLEALLGDLWRAARDGDFATFLAVREARQTRLSLYYEPEPSRRYPGEIARKLRGVVIQGDAGGVPIVTRPYDWHIRPHDSLSDGVFRFPWTRFNNSARVDLTGFFTPSDAFDRPFFSGAGQARIVLSGDTGSRPAVLAAPGEDAGDVTIAGRSDSRSMTGRTARSGKGEKCPEPGTATRPGACL